MKIYKFGWESSVFEDTMIVEVYANTIEEAKASLDIDEADLKTLKLVSTENFSIPSSGDIKFYGSFDDYIDFVDSQS